MVYDPIRDCEVPTPGTSLPSGSAWREGPDAGCPQHPPAFIHQPRSPSGPMSRSASGGLRGLLNAEPAAPDHRPSIHQLLNTAPGSPVSKSNSASSMTHSSPSLNLSPRHDNGYLHTPGIVHRSRMISPSANQDPGPSRQRLTMPPPQEVPHSEFRGSLPLRSPSVSVSPRSYHTNLQSFTPSRPGSSSSTPQPFAFRPSPSHPNRRLSEDYSRPSSVSRIRPYQPVRMTPATSVLYPISQDEISHLRGVGLSNNPLRKYKRRVLPSWSSGSRLPNESDTSYFPQDDRSRSRSSSRRPSATPGERHLKRASDDSDHGHDTSRRKIVETQYVGNAGHVADHYNARPEVGVQHRELSPIIGLKKFNNWIKSVLIGKFAHRGSGPGANVLDIGCGKGGDLNKWKQARIRLYVGMDIAATSTQQAAERYHKLTHPGFDAFFFAHDCYSKPISDALPEDLAVKNLYDNVTMQFCMHYAFESASKARMMIENVSRYLKRGGVFIGTIPDSHLLLERLGEVGDDDLQFGNSCYYVQFSERRHKGMYGHAYRFYLTDAVEEVPEYIVNWDNFEALALEYRLKLIYKKPFNEVLQEEQSSRDFGPLLVKMGVVNRDGESAMDADQWEAANLYMAFAFEKI